MSQRLVQILREAKIGTVIGVEKRVDDIVVDVAHLEVTEALIKGGANQRIRVIGRTAEQSFSQYLDLVNGDLADDKWFVINEGEIV